MENEQKPALKEAAKPATIDPPKANNGRTREGARADSEEDIRIPL